MTDEEKHILNTLADAWNAFTALPPGHGADMIDFADAVHDAQRVIMARVTYREHPEFFTPDRKDTFLTALDEYNKQ